MISIWRPLIVLFKLLLYTSTSASYSALSLSQNDNDNCAPSCAMTSFNVYVCEKETCKQESEADKSAEIKLSMQSDRIFSPNLQVRCWEVWQITSSLAHNCHIAKCIFITNWELSAFQNLEKFFINISNIRGTDGTLLQSLGRQTFSTSFYTVYLSFAFFNREGLKIIQVTIKCLWHKIS